MSIEQEAAELLERAADGFESGRYYWTRGQYSRMVFGTQAYCSLGALGHEMGHEMGQVIIGSHPVLDQAVLSLAEQVAPHAHPIDLTTNPGYLVAKWNDEMELDEQLNITPTHSKADVIEAMKRAAKELHSMTGDNV